MSTLTLTGFFKRGSTWQILHTRKDDQGAAVNISGLTQRVMFREGGVDGEVKVTLTDSDGITVTTPASGVSQLKVTALQSALFSPGAKVYFDIEQTDPVTGDVWQSNTYKFSVEQEVTRD